MQNVSITGDTKMSYLRQPWAILNCPDRSFKFLKRFKLVIYLFELVQIGPYTANNNHSLQPFPATAQRILQI